jgi:Pin2-interacting protein X1
MDVELKDTLNQAWKNDKSGFGFKMLQKMGWKEDKGLGKNEEGTTAAIKVTRRDAGVGLGAKEADTAGNSAWSSKGSSFNAVLDVLKAAYAPKKDKKKKKVKKSVPKISVGMKYLGLG